MLSLLTLLCVVAAKNPFPASQGHKVTWGYYFPGQAYQSPDTIIAQGINYLAFSFGNIASNGTFQFPGGGCNGDWQRLCWKFMESNGTADEPTGAAWFQALHDKGVAISITVGGAGATVPPPDSDAEATVASFAVPLRQYGIEAYVDGIDFDWESTTATIPINKLAKAFKSAGYIVTSAPMASQIHGGCGYKWQAPYNDLAGMDPSPMDGILLQWYQTSCDNLGHCPKATCGKAQTPDCFDLEWAVEMLTLLRDTGACTSMGTENGTTFADCSQVLDSCNVFPLEKIAIGVGLYYKQGQSAGLLTSQNVLDLDAALGNVLQGAGAWDLNFAPDDPDTASFFPDLAKAWNL